MCSNMARVSLGYWCSVGSGSGCSGSGCSGSECFGSGCSGSGCSGSGCSGSGCSGSVCHKCDDFYLSCKGNLFPLLLFQMQTKIILFSHPI